MRAHRFVHRRGAPLRRSHPQPADLPVLRERCPALPATRRAPCLRHRHAGPPAVRAPTRPVRRPPGARRVARHPPRAVRLVTADEHHTDPSAEMLRSSGRCIVFEKALSCTGGNRVRPWCRRSAARARRQARPMRSAFAAERARRDTPGRVLPISGAFWARAGRRSRREHCAESIGAYAPLQGRSFADRDHTPAGCWKAAGFGVQLTAGRGRRRRPAIQ